MTSRGPGGIWASFNALHMKKIQQCAAYYVCVYVCEMSGYFSLPFASFFQQASYKGQLGSPQQRFKAAYFLAYRASRRC